MRAIFCTAFATALMIVTASAAPTFKFDTVVTDSDTPGQDVLGRTHLVSGAGTPTTVRIGEFDYTVSATLQRDGSVRLTEIVTHHYSNGRDHVFGPYRRDFASGETVELALGSVFFATTATVR